MDALFHFGTPDTRPYKKKKLSLVPLGFTNHFQTESTENEKEEEPLSPVIFKKKSHFSQPTPKNFSFNPQKCEDEESSVNVDERPISPLKMEGLISMDSKNPHIVQKHKEKSKTVILGNKRMESKNEAMILPNINDESNFFIEKETEYDNNRITKDINEEFQLYEKQISKKKQDIDEEKIENIDERDNDESINKNLKEKISKMNFVINPIQIHTLNVKFADAAKMFEANSSDHIKRPKDRNQSNLENVINNHSYRHLIFAPYCTESTFKKHLTLTYRGLVYSKKCLKGPSDSFIKSKQVNLVESKVPRYKTLLLDLDETLVHTCNLKENPEHVIKTLDASGNENSIGLNIRPHCLEFLEKLSKYYEIFIFTASSSNYANTIINFLDPESKYINGILTRNNCMETKNGFFVKDLRIIKNRELKNIIIVDNLAHSFGFQIENGVPILEWHNHKKKDSELKYLMDYLLEILYADDVREFNKKKLKLTELAFLKMEDLML